MKKKSQGSKIMSQGFFASYPYHDCLKTATENIVKCIKEEGSAVLRTGPYFFKKAIVSTYLGTFNISTKEVRKFNISKVARVLPSKYIYAFEYKYKNQMDRIENIKMLPDTYAIHLWKKSWG